ncbi:hypothetical protein DACRYDRAFT_22971 [Dacryopinax primogenitus]|uniref:Uncharacterized protein n=1 Tax=Dacryopinax primogenitus (strain DJM 731) TaxID=1858805 RepID=M5FXI9_DACPD|nr:uncharacterized protein DACRYDRAFT_22971 [Dacryopinax primogenitus]EJU00510.1 hypothetical protein DACRYDRAFT_22971 [Dacryopinax primogenitus]
MPISTRLLLFSSLLAAPGVIPLYLLYRTTTQPGSAIRGAVGIPLALEESKLAKLLNPRGNPWLGDTWTYSIARSDISGLSQAASEALSAEDEERVVLARFARGFFTLKAFAFEKWAVSTFPQVVKEYVGLEIVDPNNTLLDPSSGKERLSVLPSQWPIDNYAPNGAAFLDAFQIVDTGRDRIYADSQLPRSYTAVAFGSNRPAARFVGVHFFWVNRRQPPADDKKSDDVIFDLNIWSLNCDPSDHGQEGSRPRWLWKWVLPQLHYLYERALMADGIDAVRSG